jgi:hypothetical protein
MSPEQKGHSVLGWILQTCLRLIYRLIVGCIIGAGAATVVGLVLVVFTLGAFTPNAEKHTAGVRGTTLDLSLLNSGLGAYAGGLAGAIVGALGAPWRVTRKGSSIWKGSCLGAVLGLVVAAIYVGVVSLILGDLGGQLLDEKRETFVLVSLVAGAIVGILAGVIASVLYRLQGRGSQSGAIEGR